MSYEATSDKKRTKPRLLLFVFLPLLFAGALFILSRPVGNFAQAQSAEPVEVADTVLVTNAIVVEDRVRLAVTVTNVGPGDEPKLISVVNTFPEGTTFASFSGDNWVCEHNEETRTADCKHEAPLPAGNRTELVLLADKGPDLRDSYLNTTAAIGTLSDPELDNNSVVTELFYLGRDVQDGVEIGSDTAEQTANDGSANDTTIVEDSSDTDRETDDNATASDNKPEPILPKTGTNLTALLVLVGAVMALTGRSMVSRSEQSKMLAFATKTHRS